MINETPAVLGFLSSSLGFLSSSLSQAAPIGPIRPSHIKDETGKKEQGGGLMVRVCTEEKRAQ